MKVENLKMVQYCSLQFFIVLNIITRHEKNKFSKNMHFSGWASSHFSHASNFGQNWAHAPHLKIIGKSRDFAYDITLIMYQGTQITEVGAF